MKEHIPKIRHSKETWIRQFTEGGWLNSRVDGAVDACKRKRLTINRSMNTGNESEGPRKGIDFNCCCSISPVYFEIDENPTIQVINCILAIPSSLTATLGNLLVLISIWRTPSLHTPSNILLVGLAFSDLGVGIVVQPIFLVYNIAKIKRLANLFCSSAVSLSFAARCLCGVSLFTLTAISLDRYMAIVFHLRYQEIVTARRLITIFVGIWLVSIVLGAIPLWAGYRPSYWLNVSIVAVCSLITVFSFCKIYRVVRRHQVQIHAQMQVQVGQQDNSLNMPQFKKSFLSMFLIYVVFLLCYFPMFLALVIISTTGITVTKYSFYELGIEIVYINSSLNPFVYCWRLEQVRVAVLETTRNISNRLATIIQGSSFCPPDE